MYVNRKGGDQMITVKQVKQAHARALALAQDLPEPFRTQGISILNQPGWVGPWNRLLKQLIQETV